MPDAFTWTSPDGASIDLTDTASGYSVLADGTRGLRSVTYEIAATQYAGFDGSTVDSVKATPNEPGVAMLLEATDEQALTDRIRGLVRAMRPKAGEGVLTVARANGERRSLSCYCVGGLEGAEDTSATLVGRWWKALLRFYAPDPWWYGDEQTVRFGLGSPTSFFPIPPVQLSPSTVQGQFQVDLSDTDTDSYPVWTITGPGSTLVLENETTGRILTVDVTLGVGETLIIDTRPGHESIRLGDGTNAMPDVLGYPDLWPLVEDINDLSVSLTGATEDSMIEGSYQPRFAGI